MAIQPSVAIGVETKPTKDQLWALAHLFQANWAQNPRIFSAFSTSIKHALTGSEQRWGRVQVPYRTIEALITTFQDITPRKVGSMLMRNAQARFLCPVWVDQTKITGSPTATNLPCEPTDRRFFVNQFVAVLKLGPGGIPDEFEVTDVTAVNANSIDVTALTTITPVAGYRIYPLIEARLALTQEAQGFTDEALGLNFTAQETTGQMALPLDTGVTIGVTPAGQAEFDGLPVWSFKPNPDTVVRGVARLGGYSELERSPTLETHGDRALHKWSASYRWFSREEFGKIRRFFESRAGRLEPFYFIAPLKELIVESITDTTIVVQAIGPEIDWDFYTHVAVVKRDGTNILKAINSVVRAGSSDTINVDSFGGSPPALADVKRVTHAYKVRFDSDEMREAWFTDEYGESEFSFVEVLDEKDKTITNLVEMLSSAEGLIGQAEGMFPGGWLYPGFRYDQPIFDRITDGSLWTRQFELVAEESFSLHHIHYHQVANGLIQIINETQSNTRTGSRSTSTVGNYSHKATFSSPFFDVQKGDRLRVRFGGGQRGYEGAVGGTSWPRGTPYNERIEGGNTLLRQSGFNHMAWETNSAGVFVHPDVIVPYAATAHFNFKDTEAMGVRLTLPFPMTVMGMYICVRFNFSTGQPFDISYFIKKKSDGSTIGQGRLNIANIFNGVVGGPLLAMLDSDVLLEAGIEYDCYFDFTNVVAGIGNSGSVYVTMQTEFQSSDEAKLNGFPWTLDDAVPLRAGDGVLPSLPTLTALPDEWINAGLVVRSIGA